MKYLLAFFYNFIFFIIIGVVFAQSSDTLFDQYDSDSDNQLTIDEFSPYYNDNFVSKCGEVVERMTKVFENEDENGDGLLTSDESEFAIQRFLSNPRTSHMVVDGKISKSDFIKCPMFTVQQIFEDFDQDKNNIISKHEWDLKKKAGYKQ